MYKVKGICWYLAFFLLLIMGLGQLPSAVGKAFLLMALLVFPGKRVRQIVDELLVILSKRWTCMFLLLLYIYCLPMEEITLAGRSFGKFLYGITQWIGYALGM